MITTWEVRVSDAEFVLLMYGEDAPGVEDVIAALNRRGIVPAAGWFYNITQPRQFDFGRGRRRGDGAKVKREEAEERRRERWHWDIWRNSNTAQQRADERYRRRKMQRADERYRRRKIQDSADGVSRQLSFGAGGAQCSGGSEAASGAAGSVD